MIFTDAATIDLGVMTKKEYYTLTRSTKSGPMSFGSNMLLSKPFSESLKMNLILSFVKGKHVQQLFVPVCFCLLGVPVPVCVSFSREAIPLISLTQYHVTVLQV